MRAAAFAASALPLVNSTWLSRHTPRRSRTSPRSPDHVCCLIPPQVPTARTSQISAVEQRFRVLGADAAADLAYVSLSTGTATVELASPTWSMLMDTLASHDINGSVLSGIAERLGVPELLRLDPAHVVSVLHYLSTYVQLADAERNRVIIRRPDILKSPEPLRNAVEALETSGMRLKDIKTVVQRWPGLLLLDARKIIRVTAFLQTPAVGFSLPNLRSLLRRAPWVLVYDIESEMTPAISYLKGVLDLPNKAPVDQFIRARPLLLGTSPDAMQKVTNFMSDVVGLTPTMLSAALRSFPPLLTCSIDATLAPAASFLSKDLSLEPDELKKLVRAFPTILTLDVEGDMRQVVNYFRRKGIINVGRIVKRLPPILGYDLDTNIIPKMEYIEQELGLSSYDILTFPGYFSYSFEKCIKPRTKFLQAKGRSVTESGLNMALGLKDEDFCERIAKVPVSQYYAFKAAFLLRRKNEKAAVEPTNDLVKESRNSNGDEEIGDEETTQNASRRLSNSNGKRRKRRFRTTLSRMPWKELK